MTAEAYPPRGSDQMGCRFQERCSGFDSYLGLRRGTSPLPTPAARRLDSITILLPGRLITRALGRGSAATKRLVD